MQPVYMSSVFPSPNRPWHGVFFQNMIQRLQLLWNEDAYTIFPTPVSALRDGLNIAGERVVELSNGTQLHQAFPPYLSISASFLSPRTAAIITISNFGRAAERAYRRQRLNAEAFYAHFLAPGGITAVRMGHIFNKPSFIALGESSYDNLKKAFTPGELQEKVRGVSGILAVGADNADFARTSLKVPEDRIITLPNAADTDVFKPFDRAEMRRKYSLPEDEVLVAFVGGFIERKGPNRVLEAIKGLDNVGAMLIGNGPMELNSDQIRLKRRIPHEELPQILSAADMFMLPTLAEGSSNAVSEALAVGLPVITSDLSFSHLIVEDDRGILVDPTDIKALHDAVATLVEHPQKREQMGKRAREWSEENSLSARAVKMKTFMEARAEAFYADR